MILMPTLDLSSLYSLEVCVSFFVIAEKLNIRVVDFSVYTGLPSASEYAEIEQAQKDHQEFLCIPRR